MIAGILYSTTMHRMEPGERITTGIGPSSKLNEKRRKQVVKYFLSTSRKSKNEAIPASRKDMMSCMIEELNEMLAQQGENVEENEPEYTFA